MIERGEKNVKMVPGKVVRDRDWLEKTQRCTELERSSLEAKMVMSEKICEELDKRTLWMEEEIVKLRREKWEVEEKLGKSEGICAELDKRIIEMEEKIEKLDVEEKMEKSCRKCGELKQKEIVVEELQQENNELRVKRMDAAQLYRPRMLKVKAKLVNSGGSGGIGLSRRGGRKTAYNSGFTGSKCAVKDDLGKNPVVRGKSSKVKKMTKQVVFLILTIYWAMAGLQTSAITDVLEVQTLQDLFRSLNCPVQLKHWKAETGDPCEETWMGVKCLGSSLITLDLHGLELTGNLKIELSNFKRLKHLDLGSNNIEGSILYSLPPKATHLILADNKFSGTIPYSIGKMKHLHHLNLSHNLLSGSLVDMFYGLQTLEKMDLSFNNFTGRLPISFICLTNLIGLFLQNNQFTGSVMFLANLSLTDLNIEDNYFSGLIPESFQNIINLRIAGNMFVTDYGPWNVPFSSMPREKYISTTSAATYLISTESDPSQSVVHKKRKSTLKIVMLIVVFTLAATFSLSILFATRKRHRRNHRRLVNPNDPMSPDESMRSLSPYSGIGSSTGTTTSSSNTSVSFSLSPSPPIRIRTIKSKRKCFARGGVSTGARVYSTEELEKATKGFSRTNYIGEASLGRVYKAEFADGTVVAVKYIKIPSAIFINRPFLDVIEIIFSLEHPNILRLHGYSVNLDFLVYEFIQMSSLHEALHGNTHRTLTYRERLQIALGVAQALDYMHSSYEPPISYANLKAGNILLNGELKAFLGDCDLAIFSNIVGPGNPKVDVYNFGELFLELLTFDSARTQEEWLSSMLHNCISFENTIDPDIKEQIPLRGLYDLADLVSICVQSNMDSRPSMYVVVDYLRQLERQIESGVELFHFSALRDATNNFGSNCLIEDSEWWRVYKGSFEGGKVYAVKELRNSLLVRTDDESLEEISKLQLWRHPNLVSMIGYCVHEGKIYIISDLVPSKSLASLLHDDSLHLPRLEWRERMIIALQVARGLEFMHQNDALVKNLSAFTVFVGDYLRTVIGDVWIPSMFYMHSPKPWLSPGECYVEHADPYNSIRGYNPPESSLYYFVFSKEWDVYSFGILFLVLITGKEAYDDDVGSSFDMELLINRVRPTIEGGLPESMFELLDNHIMVTYSELEQALDLVYKCTNERKELRPTMSEVVELLKEFI